VALLELSVGVQGDKAAVAQLGLAVERLGDLSKPFNEAADLIENHLERKFKGRGVDPKLPGDRQWSGYENERKYWGYKFGNLGPAGIRGIGRWNRAGPKAPFGPRERLGPSFANRHHPEHVRRVTKRSLEVGSRVPYADRFHRGGRNLFGESHPGRKIVTPNRKLLLAMSKIVQRHVDQAFARGAPRGRRGGTARLTGLAGRRAPVTRGGRR
jgi:hypothetical protein